ncbi:MAG: alpha/beta hydrolase [Alphaproteobacteria bacterium]|nr:alpha/beta hydrolase [Alphaproteobacteria bacterium]
MTAPGAFTFPLDPAELLAERAPQWLRSGLPRATLRQARSRIHEMWEDAPGGWAYEWSRLAEAHAARGQWLTASLVYGAARFPTASTPAAAEAHRQQLACHLRAAPRFACDFERIEVPVTLEGQGRRVPVHVFTPRGVGAGCPTVVFSAGVDTWKMDLHRLVTTLARLVGARVVALDMPGTGESDLALSPSGDLVYEAALDAIAEGRRAAFGLRFGGHWAARLALRGVVDAAVDVGGPVGAEAREAGLLTRLPNGMTGIVAHAMRLGHLPDVAEAERLLRAYSLPEQGLDLHRGGVPMLVVNGDQDPYVPVGDTTVFRGRPDTEVWLVRGSGHCVPERFVRVLPAAAGWLRRQLHGPGWRSRLLEGLGRAILPPLA